MLNELNEHSLTSDRDFGLPESKSYIMINNPIDYYLVDNNGGFTEEEALGQCIVRSSSA